MDSEGYNFNFKWLQFVPIIIVIGVIPLVTRLSLVEVDPALYEAFGQGPMSDFFSQYKAIFIISMAVASIIGLLMIFDKNSLKIDFWTRISVIGIAIYWAMTALSTILSDTTGVALWGVPDRAEGFVVITSYIILFLYTFYIVKGKDDFKFLIWPLAFLVVVIGILGVSQFTGNDFLLNTQWGKNLIIPSQYEYLKAQIQPLYEKGNIYGTLYHYNYVGSFAAITVPFFLTLCLFSETLREKVIYGVICLIAVWLLIGSTARSGLIGAACAAIVFLIVFSKQLLKLWKVTIPVFIIGIIGLIILNFISNDMLFSRIPALVQDMFAILVSSESNINYKDLIPVREMYLADDSKKLVLEMQQHTLSITIENRQPVVTIEDGSVIPFVAQGGVLISSDARFENVKLETVDISSDVVGLIVNIDDENACIVESNATNGMYFVNGTTGLPMLVEDADYIGFEGKEQLGSSRGYIWSRSFPMMLDTIFIGNGPDTYVLKFPQGDRLAKWYAYGTPDMLVDKPHNLYLQIAINQSGIALIAFLVVVGFYIVNSIRLYAFKDDFSYGAILGSACLMAVVGFLGAGIFNDSVVSVSPIFWVILGFGIAINYIIGQERITNN
ncbi:MAG: hypothetical protein BEN18_04670 [Epulopiscium sp. Nuni2H_MBin001]|nr:MAG: hypothetical protein BEN18_04670 [Epulopiscium sp. Nuni2H_MBin001]